MRVLKILGVIVLFSVLGVWLNIGSFSDEIVGNDTMADSPPGCDDPAHCEALKEHFIADAHSDTLMHRSPIHATEKGHVDIHRLAAGGVDLQVFALASVAPKLSHVNGKVCGDIGNGDRLTAYFIAKEPLHPGTWFDPFARVEHMIERLDEAVVSNEAAPLKLVKITTKGNLETLASQPPGSGQVGALLAVEGAYWASESQEELIAQLDLLESAGVRMVGLTHRSSNQLAGSNEDCNDKHGLTDLGRFATLEIWKRNMVLDLAHASSDTIRDVTELALQDPARQVIVSHTGVRAACDHDRNLTNEDVRNVARAGGVVGLGFWTTVNCFGVDSSMEDARKAIGRSFAAAYDVLNAPDFRAEMGPDFDAVNHIALGSDFDGAITSPIDVSSIPWVLEGLGLVERNGKPLFDATAVEKIAGANTQRLLRRALPG